MKHIVSFSGGKDSTAMLLRLLEEKYPVDDIVFFDTGWEFPEMHQHIQKVQEYIGRKITVLKSEKTFEYWMFERPIKKKSGEGKGEIHRIGNGWPSPMRRWCTRIKVQTIDKYMSKNAVRYIGIAADEAHRTETKNLNQYEIKYPLISWDMSEPEALQYCYDRGFNWGGLYNRFRRVSCFCCPLQRLGELKKLRKYYPQLWAKMLKWDSMQPTHNQGFRDCTTVHDLDRRFAQEPSFHNYMEQMNKKEVNYV